MQSVGEIIEQARIYEQTKKKLKQEKAKQRKEKLKKALSSIGKEVKKGRMDLKKLTKTKIPKGRYQGIPIGRNIYD